MHQDNLKKVGLFSLIVYFSYRELTSEGLIWFEELVPSWSPLVLSHNDSYLEFDEELNAIFQDKVWMKILHTQHCWTAL